MRPALTEDLVALAQAFPDSAVAACNFDFHWPFTAPLRGDSRPHCYFSFRNLVPSKRHDPHETHDSLYLYTLVSNPTNSSRCASVDMMQQVQVMLHLVDSVRVPPKDGHYPLSQTARNTKIHQDNLARLILHGIA